MFLFLNPEMCMPPYQSISSSPSCLWLCRTIAPFNEPSSIYWWAGNNQEGCHFAITTQNIIIGKLQNMLEQKGLAQVSFCSRSAALLHTSPVTNSPYAPSFNAHTDGIVRCLSFCLLT